MPIYTYRRNLHREDWLKVAGAGFAAGLGAGVAVAYLTRIFLQRTPLRDAPPVVVAGRPEIRSPAP